MSSTMGRGVANNSATKDNGNVVGRGIASGSDSGGGFRTISISTSTNGDNGNHSSNGDEILALNERSTTQDSNHNDYDHNEYGHAYDYNANPNSDDYDDDDEDEDDEQRQQYEKEARPVAIMLRNCFPPSRIIDNDATSTNIDIHTNQSNDNNDNNDNDHDNDDTCKKMEKDRIKHENDGDNDNDNDDQQTGNKDASIDADINTDIDAVIEEHEYDTTLNNYEIFTKTNQWRNQANQNIFLPIEMEIVVSHTFLIQLHHHQNDEKVRSRIRHLFGLEEYQNQEMNGSVSNLNCNGNNNSSNNNNNNSNNSDNKCINTINTMNHEERKRIKKMKDDRVIVLCSKLQDTRSSHPLWNHVNEKLDDLYDLIPKGHDLWNDLYKAMRIQFRAIVPSQQHEQNHQQQQQQQQQQQSQMDDKNIHNLKNIDQNDVDANDNKNNNNDGNNGNEGNDSSSTSSSSSSNDEDLESTNDLINCKQSKSIILATLPLHPCKLKPISPSMQNCDTSNNDNKKNKNNNSSILGSSKFNEAIPNSLPPNSIIVHYSDGTTRVCPQLFDLLIKKKVLVLNKSDSSAFSEKVEVDKFAKRFEDDVFDVLEDQGYVKAKLELELNGGGNAGDTNSNLDNHSQAKVGGNSGDDHDYHDHTRIHTSTSTNSSTTETSSSSFVNKMKIKKKNQEYNKLPIKLTADRNNFNGSSTGFSSIATANYGNAKASHSQPSSRSSSRGAFADAFDSMKVTTSSNNNSKSLKCEMADTDMEGNNDEVSTNHLICNEEDINITVSGQDVPSSELQKEHNECDHRIVDVAKEEEIDELEREIEQLENILEQKGKKITENIESQKMSLNYLMDIEKSLANLEKEINEINLGAEEASITCQRAQLTLDARQKKMLQELFHIYPIQVLPDSVYTIRGIHLPHDMHSLTASDEIISAGLGFVCHVVSLCSKYLSIPLRYRLICNSSRSAVRYDDYDVFPLFKERVVVNEQFDRAVVLLHRNIEFLLQMSGISESKTPTPKSKPNHILAKLYLLFHSIIDINATGWYANNS